MTPDPIAAELLNLEIRKAQLQKLLAARNEVRLLELDLLSGTGDRERARIIIEETAKGFGLRLEQMFSKGRPQIITGPRFAAFLLIRQHTNLVLDAIGEIFAKDHGTVIHGIQAAKDRMATEPAFKRAVGVIEQAAMAGFEKNGTINSTTAP